MLQESLGGLGGSPHIMVEWKEGSKDEGWVMEGLCHDSLDGDCSQLGPSGFVLLV
jgi:hypothetical protein